MNEKLRLGEFSFLSVSFHLQRHMGNFILQVYGPCTLLVVMSWVSFWLNRESTAERVSLGITTILTMTFLGLEARTDLPKVSYPTALDFFVFLSFLFIFATIIQFAIVHYFTKYGSGEDYFIETSSEEEEEEDEEAEDEPVNRELDEEQLGGLRYVGGQMSIISLQSGPRFNNGGMGRRFAASGLQEETEFRQQHQYRQTRRPPSRWTFSARERAERERKRELRQIAQAQRQQELDSVNSVSKIDIFARIAFPLSFFLINVFYWYSYLYAEQVE